MITPSSIAPVIWPIEEVVEKLREVRNRSLAARNRLRNPTILPSRTTLSQIVDSLGAGLFPNRLGKREMTVQTIDYFVGQVLDLALNELAEQIEMELQVAQQDNLSRKEIRESAVEIVRLFSMELPAIRELIDSDIAAAFKSDPAAKSMDEILACYPGIFAIIHHRIAHLLYVLGVPLIARMISEVAHSKSGIDIHPGAKIGSEFFIDHGTGVVIGETAIIEQRVRIYHGVTLGGMTNEETNDSRVTHGERRHPKVEEGVVIYAGATLLGKINIGRKSVIGGNVWITDDVPAGSHVSQAKFRSEIFQEGLGI
jgi:serine O-acetyltransferase